MTTCGKNILSVALFLSALLFLAGCRGTPTNPSAPPTYPIRPTSSSTIAISPTILPTSTLTSSPSASPSVSNGQRIYNTSTSSSEEPVTYTEGPGMMMPLNLTCAQCHGADGYGGTIHFMMGTYDVPNITWPELTAPGMMDYPPYTEDTLKRAITRGLDPAGNSLEYPMLL